MGDRQLEPADHMIGVAQTLVHEASVLMADPTPKPKASKTGGAARDRWL